MKILIKSSAATGNDAEPVFPLYGTSQRRLRRRFSTVRAGHQRTSPTLLQ